jgi:hypothetical protein
MACMNALPGLGVFLIAPVPVLDFAPCLRRSARDQPGDVRRLVDAAGDFDHDSEVMVGQEFS